MTSNDGLYAFCSMYIFVYVCDSTSLRSRSLFHIQSADSFENRNDIWQRLGFSAFLHTNTENLIWKCVFWNEYRRNHQIIIIGVVPLAWTYIRTVVPRVYTHHTRRRWNWPLEQLSGTATSSSKKKNDDVRFDEIWWKKYATILEMLRKYIDRRATHTYTRTKWRSGNGSSLDKQKQKHLFFSWALRSELQMRAHVYGCYVLCVFCFRNFRMQRKKICAFFFSINRVILLSRQAHASHTKMEMDCWSGNFTRHKFVCLMYARP